MGLNELGLTTELGVESREEEIELMENDGNNSPISSGGFPGWSSPRTMSIISWICHGFGTPWAFQFFKELTLQNKPDFIFLNDILCGKDRVEQFCLNIGFEGNVVVETRGHNGGIALL